MKAAIESSMDMDIYRDAAEREAEEAEELAYIRSRIIDDIQLYQNWDMVNVCTEPHDTRSFTQPLHPTFNY
ncbi:MAG: hypothetical protein IT422_22570 [Pirellulaceae bacterium]|nr:hypothetical protein [Pirellulaceae bacterium]